MSKIAKGKKYTVTKSKALNGARMSEFNLQELRFLCLYLGMINPKDPGTNRQNFALNDFRAIMELEVLPPRDVEKAMDGLLKKPITIMAADGSLEKFPLFCEANLCKDGKGGWAVEIVAFDKAMPLMFKLQENWQYFKYCMWHALELKSRNQLRLYEWLKQHEYQASRGGKYVTVADLKAALDLKPEEYPEYKDFKKKVLEPCRISIEERTDITFEYEVAEKAAHGRTFALLFKVKNNPARAHEDQLRLNEFKNLIEGNEAYNAETGNNTIYDKQMHEKGGAGDEATPATRAASPAGPGAGAEVHADAIAAINWASENRLTPKKAELLHSLIAGALPEIAEAGPAAIGRHVKCWYDYAREQEIAGNIRTTFYAYLKSLVVHPVPGSEMDIARKEAAADRAAAKPKKNRFANFKQRTYNWEELEKLERHHQCKKYGIEAPPYMVNGKPYDDLTEEEMQAYYKTLQSSPV